MDQDELRIAKEKLGLERSRIRAQWLGTLLALLTPVAIVWFGYIIQDELNEKERQFQSGERRAEQRKEVYASLSPLLNKIYCYVDEKGDFKVHTPLDIIDFKRVADRTYHRYHGYWSKTTKTAYNDFMEACFLMGKGGIASDAPIKANTHQKKVALGLRGIAWEPEWDRRFRPKLKDTKVREKYLAMVIAFLDDLKRNDELSPDDPKSKSER